MDKWTLLTMNAVLVFLSGPLHLFTLPSGPLMASTLQLLERFVLLWRSVKGEQRKRCLWLKCINVPVVFALRRMTVYWRCGIPPLAGAPQWWSRTPRIKSLLRFTSPSFTWPTLAQSLACPGGRPANTCPSKKAEAAMTPVLPSQLSKNQNPKTDPSDFKSAGWQAVGLTSDERPWPGPQSNSFLFPFTKKKFNNLTHFPYSCYNTNINILIPDLVSHFKIINTNIDPQPVMSSILWTGMKHITLYFSAGQIPLIQSKEPIAVWH